MAQTDNINKESEKTIDYIGSPAYKAMYRRLKNRIDGLIDTLPSQLKEWATSMFVKSVNGKSGSEITISKGDVGLGNVDNTADADKHVAHASTADDADTLDGKHAEDFLLKSEHEDYASEISSALTDIESRKVDKVEGKELSSNDFTDEEKQKLAGIEAGAQENTVASVAGKTGDVVIGKDDVGLANVDNTSDKDKRVAHAETAGDADTLDGKQAEDFLLKTEHDTYASTIATALTELNSSKVDKENGKGLSSNDYTNDEKQKLAGIESGAQKHIAPTGDEVKNALGFTPADANTLVGYLVTVTELGESGNTLKSYVMTQNGSQIAKIDIPKDLVVTKDGSGIVVGNWVNDVFTEDPNGAGKAIKLVIANQTDPIYIDVKDLVDVYTAAKGATEIQIAISSTNEISATLVKAVRDKIDNAIPKVSGAEGKVAQFNADGNLESSSFEIKKSVPSDALFTDTIIDNEAGDGIDVSGEHNKKIALSVGTKTILADAVSDHAKLAGIEEGAQKNTVTSVAGKTGDVIIDKEDVGLGNVDNTADADKNVAHAATADNAVTLDGKHAEDFLLKTEHEDFASEISSSLSDLDARKVDKVDGKGLSANDFTDEDKAKLTGIEEGAQVNDPNTVVDENYVHTDNNYTTDEKNKLEGIEDGAQKNTVTSVAGKTGDVVLEKGDVGLGNVDNTADSDKHVAHAETAGDADTLDGKQAEDFLLKTEHDEYKSAVDTALADLDSKKVDKEEGKGLSTNDFTDEEKQKLEGIEAGAQKNTVTSVSGKTGDVVLDKDDVGLGNVDNTADADKNVSHAETAGDADTLDGKQAEDFLLKTEHDEYKSAVDTALADLDERKVDKVEGKDLSTNDYTTEEKQKLAGIEEGAQVNAPNTVIDANYVHTDNNYTTAEKNKLEGIESGAQKNTVTSVAGKTGAVVLRKSDVGLGNVDNTADADKNVAHAVTADDTDTLDGKHAEDFLLKTEHEDYASVIASSLNDLESRKVDKEEGKGLSSNDYTDEDKDKLTGIEAGAQRNTVTSVSGKTGDVTLEKGDVGLGNVDNTADADKNVSHAETAGDADTLDGKQAEDFLLKTEHEAYAESVSTAITSLETNKADKDVLTSLDERKVDKVDGKDLSSNDYTDADKQKLEGIEAGAQVNAPNTVVDANYVHTDNNYTTAEKNKLAGIETGAQKNTVTSVAGKKGAVTLRKGDVGLGNVDNTADADKNVAHSSTADDADTLDGNHAEDFMTKSEHEEYEETIATALTDLDNRKIEASDIPTSLPANGGNADYAESAGNAGTLGGYHESAFSKNGHTHTTSEITNFPTIGNGALHIKVNGTEITPEGGIFTANKGGDSTINIPVPTSESIEQSTLNKLGDKVVLKNDFTTELAKEMAEVLSTKNEYKGLIFKFEYLDRRLECNPDILSVNYINVGGFYRLNISGSFLLNGFNFAEQKEQNNYDPVLYSVKSGTINNVQLSAQKTGMLYLRLSGIQATAQQAYGPVMFELSVFVEKLSSDYNEGIYGTLDIKQFYS